MTLQLVLALWVGYLIWRFAAHERCLASWAARAVRRFAAAEALFPPLPRTARPTWSGLPLRAALAALRVALAPVAAAFRGSGLLGQ